MNKPEINDPRLGLEYLPMTQMGASPNRSRTHPPRQIEELRRSIQTFGFLVPILVDDHGMLLSGHARIEAAEQLGITEIPAIRVSHLSNAEKRAFMLADNRLAELASWDEDSLRRELKFLSELEIEFDFSAIGFDTAEVDVWLEEQAEDETEKGVSATEQTPISRPGDLWRLGAHAVFCGDALKAESYEVLLAGDKAQLAFTDPPYNVPIDGHALTSFANKHREFAMANGEMTPDAYTTFLSTVFGFFALHTIDGAIIFTCMDWRHGLEILQAGKLLSLKNICVWVKNNGGMGSLYRSQHEFVYVFKNGTSPHINNVELGKHGRSRTNVWDYRGINSFGRDRGELLKMHPTVKPVALVVDAIRDCSHRGGLILDAFAGSGTTVIAAEKTKRRAAVIEIDPLYVDVIVRRWQKLTGKVAVCAEDGETFADREMQARSRSAAVQLQTNEALS